MSNKGNGDHKLNDGSHNSGKYHKKDGTARRAILKRDTVQRVTVDAIFANPKGWMK